MHCCLTIPTAPGERHKGSTRQASEEAPLQLKSQAVMDQLSRRRLELAYYGIGPIAGKTLGEFWLQPHCR